MRDVWAQIAWTTFDPEDRADLWWSRYDLGFLASCNISPR